MKFSFTLALFSFLLILGQSEDLRSQPRPAVELETLRGFSVHAMPFSFATRFPRARIGAQYLTERWSYLLDLEHGNSSILGIVLPNRNKNAIFYGLRPELRRTYRKQNNEAYVGLEMPMNVFQKDFRGAFRTDQGGQLSVSAARQERLRVGLILKLGLQLLAWKHFAIDAYGGAGIAYRKLNYYERENQQPFNRPSDDEFCMIICDLADVRSGIVPELAFGFRFGYYFR